MVLDNARKIAAAGKPMWVRTPVIPGYTDDEANIRAIARFIRDNLPTVERYDILAFNNTCAGKYERLGYEFALADEALIREETMERLAAVAREEGLDFRPLVGHDPPRDRGAGILIEHERTDKWTK